MNKETKKQSTAKTLTYMALFVALTAVCSWISVPLPWTSVPINLATFAVLLAGVTLGRKQGTLAIAVFLCLGAVGVPVFHSFTGGLGILLGPTGGYLIGYLALAWCGGLSRDTAMPYIPAAVLGEVLLYALGTAWFILESGSTLAVAVAACILPFIPGDVIKMVLVALVKRRAIRAVA